MRTLRFTALFLLLSTPAFAQPHHRSQSLYLFDDDLLQGLSTFPSSLLIRTRKPKRSAGLIRPRTEFVEELRRTVEDL